MAILTGMRAEWISGYDIVVYLSGSDLAGKTYQIDIGRYPYNGVVPDSLQIYINLEDNPNNFYSGQSYDIHIIVNAEEELSASCSFVFAPITTPQPVITNFDVFQEAPGGFKVGVYLWTENAIGRYYSVDIGGLPLSSGYITSDRTELYFDLSDYGSYELGDEYWFNCSVNTDTEPIFQSTKLVLDVLSSPTINSFDAWCVSDKTITVNWIADNIYYNHTAYEIRYRTGNSYWNVGGEGIITSVNNGMDFSFSVDEYADYEVKLLLSNSGDGVESSTIVVSVMGMNGISVQQLALGELETTVVLYGENLVGGHYTVYVDDVEYGRGIVKSDNSINNVAFPILGRHYIKAEVSKNNGSISYTEQVELYTPELTISIGNILYEQNHVYVYPSYPFDIGDLSVCLYVRPSTSSEWEYIIDNNRLYGIWSFHSYMPVYGESYDIKISCRYNGTTVESSFVTMNVKELPTVSGPQNLQVARLNNAIYLSWDNVDGANVYYVDYYYDDDWVYNDVYTNYITLYNVGYGVSNSYIIYTGVHNKYYIGECVVEEISYSEDDYIDATITSAPARPKITSATQDEGVITVRWALEDASSPVSKVWINLYDSNNAVLQTREVTGYTSGTVTYEAVEDGTYYVKIAVALDLSNPDYDGVIQIQSKNDDGTDFTLISDAIIIGDRPAKWEWSSGIAKGKSVTVDATGIHPITATEWIKFINRINEFRVYKGYSEYKFSAISKGGDFKTAYNEAVNAIKGVENCGQYVSIITNTTNAVVDCKFQISLFDKIRKEANAIVGYTD